MTDVYFTVAIPYTDRDPTEWHPTESTGPFSILQRGAFASAVEAHQWAKDHLRGHKYAVVKVGVPGETSISWVRGARDRGEP